MPNETIGLHRPGTLILVGLHSSGKTTLARALARRLEVRVVEMGNIVRQEARQRSQDNLVLLARELLDDDPLAIARRAVASARARPLPFLTVIVGPRTKLELDFLISELQAPSVLGIVADPALRRARWRRRSLRFSDTWAQREANEHRWGTEHLLGECDSLVSAAQTPTEKVTAALRLIGLSDEQ